MNTVCTALALLFAYLVFAPPVEARIDYTPTGWSSR